MAKTFNLADQIRKEAVNNEVENQTHHDICVALVKLADTFNDRTHNGHFIKGRVGFTHTKKGKIKPYPLAQMVYFAVSKEGHKVGNFQKGYTKFDEKKAKTILQMLKYFGEYHNNHELARNGNLAHAVCKYYEKVSPKLNDFKTMVEKVHTTKGYKIPKTMKEITILWGIDTPKE